MSIKKNVKSTLLTALLVSSLSCGLKASDMIEEGYRLQITGSYNLLSAQIAAVQASIDALPTALQVSAAEVSALGANPVLTTTVAGTNSADYNAAMAAVTAALATAKATPNRANISALQTAINADATGLLPTAAALTGVTSTYSEVGIVSAAELLNTAVTNWLSFYPAA